MQPCLTEHLELVIRCTRINMHIASDRDTSSAGKTEETANDGIWHLPDFGEPITNRDRAAYHEPTQGHHYSEQEDQGWI